MTPPPFESTYQYTVDLAGRLTRRQLRTRYTGLFTYLAVASIFAIVLLREASLHLLSGFLLGFVTAIVVMLFKSYRSAMATALIHCDHPIALRIDEHGIRMSSELLTSDVPWQSIAKAQRTPEGLLLLRRGSPSPTAIPNEALSADALAFVLASVTAAGGKIGRDVTQ